MKTFDLKPVLALLNTFTSQVRETVMAIFQVSFSFGISIPKNATSCVQCIGHRILLY